MGVNRQALRRKALFGLVALIATVAGCGDSGKPLDELRAMPEVALEYPGSEEVNSGGGEGRMTLDGPQSAFAWRWLGTEATYEDVERFYAEELASRGWSDGGGSSGIRTTSEFSARAWHKDDAMFRLAFLDPEAFADQEPFSRHQTVYDARVRGRVGGS